MMKKFAAIILSLCLVLTMLSACGDEIDNNPTPPADNSVTDQQSPENPDSQPDGNGGDALSELDLGFVYDNGIEYIWDQLDDEMKTDVAQVINTIKNVGFICELSYGIPADESKDFLTFISNLCMDYCYLGSSFTFRDTDDDGLKDTLYLQYNENIAYEQDALNIVTNLNAVLDSVVANIPEGLSEWERAKYLYEYLVLSTDYSDEAMYPFTAYGALVEHRATCQGYAEAMHLLLHRAGFEVCYVRGHGDDTAQIHKWNYVKLSDGQWYILDPTWADPADVPEEDYINYDYFLISDEAILLNHKEKFYSNYYTTPTATSMEQSYHKVMGYYCESYDEAYAAAQKQVEICADDGKRYIYLRFPTAELTEEVRQELCLKKGAGLMTILKDVNAEKGSNFTETSWKVYPGDNQTSPNTIIITLKRDE